MHIPMALAVPLLVAAGVLAALAWRFLRNSRKTVEDEPDGSIEMTCTICRRELVFTPSAMEPLSPPEMALVVRARPEMVRRRLSDYTCPYCEAAHCFATDRRIPEWVGANLYQPSDISAHCFECHRPLRRLPGATGGITERIVDASGLEADVGLKCPSCHSVCCAECCRRAARGHTRDGALMCPRCSRKPVDLLYHP